jgi:2-aminoadipate transaminase
MRAAFIPPDETRLVSRVVGQVVGEIGRGVWRPTDRLPSERDCAQTLGVSRNKVTAAYGELERQGGIRRFRGKGAFVCALPSSEESFSWSGKISNLAHSMDEPVLELLARRLGGSDIVYPLSAGTPSLEVFSRDAYRASINRKMAHSLPGALAVSHTEGQWALRRAIAEWTGVDPHHVMILAGAQEAIDIVARCLIEPGDAVVIDSPTYPGAIQSFRSAGARLLPWSTKWSLTELQELFLRYRPKLLFTMPTIHHPTGRVMPLKVRLGLLELACRYHVPVIEDDVYGRTFFGSQTMPESLYQLDKHAQVLTLSPFSNMLAPGLRVGWLVAPLYMIKQLSLIKMRSNLFTGGLDQLALA